MINMIKTLTIFSVFFVIDEEEYNNKKDVI